METAVTIRCYLDDDDEFEFEATGDGNRMIVSRGMRELMDHKYWSLIQKTCKDLQPATNKQESVPTKWFLDTTANPPSFVKPHHRRILRMVHMLCQDALGEGANFRSDKIFARKTPVLQVERNVLESADFWEYVPEVECKPEKKKKRRLVSSSDDDDADRANTQGPHPNRPRLLLFGPDVTDLTVIDATITSSTTAANIAQFGIPMLRGIFYESKSILDFARGVAALRKIEIEEKHLELDMNSNRTETQETSKSARERAATELAAKIAREDNDAKSVSERAATELAAKIAREDADAAAKIARDDADAAAKRETAQERERMEIEQAAKKLEMERKANFKQGGGSDRMRKPGKRLLLTDQRAQIVELWGSKFGFSYIPGDEMVVCTAHADCRDFHCMSMYDALAFDTELGEVAEDRRATMAPGCAKGLFLMGVSGGVVLTRLTGLRNELLHFYSRKSNAGREGREGLLRTHLPCNVTGFEKLVCSMEWDHVESVARGGADEPSNLHLISAGLNATIGESNTRAWAAENGHGPLKCEPPTPTELAASLQLWSWNGRDTTPETTIRLARARIEILEPWEGVLESIKRKVKKTGQSILNFPRAAPANTATAVPILSQEQQPSPLEPESEQHDQVDVKCHHKRCNVVVLDAAGNILDGIGLKTGKQVYCAPHATKHAATLLRARQYRAEAKRQKQA